MSDTGWIARDRAARFWDENANIPVDDWKRFATECGLRLVWVRIPIGRDAFLIGKTIFIRPGLSENDEQEAVCHEMCHRSLHACNMLWWENKPYGEYVIAKYERQARELAGLLR